MQQVQRLAHAVQPTFGKEMQRSTKDLLQDSSPLSCALGAIFCLSRGTRVEI